MEMENEWMQEALKSSEDHYKEGDIVSGKVVDVTKEGMIVDVGLKSEGLIPIADFEKGGQDFKVGDTIEALLIKKESKSGQLILSYLRALQIRMWEKLELAFKQEEILSGIIKRKIKGGVNVEIFNMEVFMPASQIGLSYIKDLDALKEQAVRVKIIKFDRQKSNAVVSQRIVLEEELKQKKEKLWSELKEGESRRGIITNIAEFGAFVDLDGAEGLLHVNDISWGRVKKASDVLNMGEEIEVKILQADRLNEKISLGLKQLTPDPWFSAPQKYKVDSIVNGKVISLTDFGAFVELEVGVEGLIHVSEMSWVDYVKHPSKLLKIGDIVKAKVLAIDPEKHKISLGLKQIQPNPWDEAAQKYSPGTRVSGVVSHLAPFGAFVKLTDGIEGLIHVSDLSWQEKITHPNKILKVNDKVEAMVLKVDVKEEKLSLGFKQLQSNPVAGFKVGENLEVEVTEILGQGIVVVITPSLKGFIHVSQLANDYIEEPSKVVKVGQKVNAKIIKIDRDEGKINLSIKEYNKDVRKETVAKYVKAVEQKVTLGDVMGESLAKFLKKE